MESLRSLGVDQVKNAQPCLCPAYYKAVNERALQVGGTEWRSQQGQITRLNLQVFVLTTFCLNLILLAFASLLLSQVCFVQAHHNAQTHSDEFVKSALVSFDKLPILVQELLTFEVGHAAKPSLPAC